MKEHLGTDAIVAIGEALNWDVSEGLRHLQTCEECGDQLEVLRLTREGLADAEPVDAAVVRRIQAALGAAAGRERKRARVRERLGQLGEGFLAGITALIVVASNKIDIEDIGAAVITFAFAATLMVSGRVLARNVSIFGKQDLHA